MIENISTSNIRPPHYRLRDDVGDLEELKASMKAKGLLEPLIVRKVDNKFEIIAGQRRFLSALEIGWAEIECKVIVADDKEAFEFALLENLQRKTMEPLEEAVAFHAYVNKYGYGSGKDLALKIGKSPSYISSRLTLVDTSEDIKALVREKKLSVSDAEEVAKATTEKSTRIAELASEVGLTSKQIRTAVNLANSGLDAEQAVQTAVQYAEWEIDKLKTPFNPIAVAREHLVLTLQRALKDLDENIHRLGEGAEAARWTHEIRFPLHQLEDAAMKLKDEFAKKKVKA